MGCGGGGVTDELGVMACGVVGGWAGRKGAGADIAGTVVDRHELSTHTLFFLRVDAAQLVAGGEPMTYDYYHRVVKGRTPKHATTYVPPEAVQNSSPVREAQPIMKKINENTKEETTPK